MGFSAFERSGRISAGLLKDFGDFLRLPVAFGAISAILRGISLAFGGFRRISADKGDPESRFRVEQSARLSKKTRFSDSNCAARPRQDLAGLGGAAVRARVRREG